MEVNLNCLREKERKGDGVEVGRGRKRKWKSEFHTKRKQGEGKVDEWLTLGGEWGRPSDSELGLRARLGFFSRTEV